MSPQKPNLQRIDDVTRTVIDEARRKQEHPEDFRPIKTNLEDLDAIIGGITEGLYVVVGGAFKTGKSSLALHIATALAASGRGRTEFYSLEELRDQMGTRSLVRLTDKVDRTMMRNLVLQKQHFDELESAQNLLKEGKVNLWLDDGLSQVEVIIKTSTDNGAKFVIVDYLQLLESKTGHRDSYVQQWDEISAQFVRARNQTKITFIVVYQIGEQGKAYGSRAVYRDADLIIEVERKIDIVTEKELEELIHINVRRSRICMSGECDLAFSGAHSRVGNILPLNLDMV